jgi:preprotein translocase subunit SecF
MITVGVFSIANKEFTLPIVAAILTIIGYSLNDTIVVYDRIRENRRKMRRQPFAKVINASINETLGRTLLTSLTTLIVVVILFIFGGGVIHNFAFALIVGVLVGTYSSVFVASPIILTWQERK